MKTFHDQLTENFKEWLNTRLLLIKEINEQLYVIYNSKYCIKIYDQIGHGYGVNVNLSESYDESIYEYDACSMYWIFKYFGLKRKSDFSSRKLSDYEENLPLLMTDIKNLIEAIELTDEKFWQDSLKWIQEHAKV